MKLNNFEFRIDHKKTGYLPYGFAVIFYGNNIVDENVGGETMLVTEHPKNKNKVLIFNATFDQTIELNKKDLNKFCRELQFPHVVYCLAFPKEDKNED